MIKIKVFHPSWLYPCLIYTTTLVLIEGILISGNLATGLRKGGRRFGFFVVDGVTIVVLVVVVRGRKLG